MSLVRRSASHRAASPVAAGAADLDTGEVSIADAITAVQAAPHSRAAPPRCPIIAVVADDGASLAGSGLATDRGEKGDFGCPAART